MKTKDLFYLIIVLVTFSSCGTGNFASKKYLHLDRIKSTERNPSGVNSVIVHEAEIFNVMSVDKKGNVVSAEDTINLSYAAEVIAPSSKISSQQKSGQNSVADSTNFTKPEIISGNKKSIINWTYNTIESKLKKNLSGNDSAINSASPFQLKSLNFDKSGIEIIFGFLFALLIAAASIVVVFIVFAIIIHAVYNYVW